MHPRLSVHDMCTFPLPFGEELVVWDELHAHQVGVSGRKLDTYGRDEAIAALRDRSIVTTTVTTGSFDLASHENWEETRQDMSDAVELAAELGGSVYFTPGRRNGRSFDEMTKTLAEAVAPCVEFARSKGVRLAIELSQRTDVSYVHTLRDGLDVADQIGVDVIADLGNCWMERDYEKTVRRAGERIACVQFADAVFGGFGSPPPGGRAVPGDGDLPIRAFIEAAVEGGYTGPFELEQVGPLIEAEGHVPALRRGVERANALLEEIFG
jgi:sugar phosphate isomerase/epimerase